MDPEPIQPTPPASSQFSLIPVILAIVFFISTILLAYQNWQLQKQIQIFKSKPNYTSQNIPPSPTITTPQIADWKSITGTSFAYQNSVYSGYTFKYPPTCRYTTTTLECKTPANDTFTIVINAGGHGLGDITVLKKDEIKSYPAGNVKASLWKGTTNDRIGGVYWFYKTNKVQEDFLFGFELVDASTKSQTDAEDTIDQILSTFTFIDATKTDELTEVRNFVDDYATTFVAGNWPKFSTLLTTEAAKDMTNNQSSLPTDGYSLTGYTVMSLTKNTTTGNYTAIIRFDRDGQALKNPSGDPQILITKENDAWKSLTWYLYQ